MGFSIHIKDRMFACQLQGRELAPLDTTTLMTIGITQSKDRASKIIASCKRRGIITAAGRPDTRCINGDIMAAMPTISVPQVKQLVRLLFFWEEEFVRWDMLHREQEQLRALLAATELDDATRMELEDALQVLKARQGVLPSQRDAGGGVRATTDEHLPSYVEARAQRHNHILVRDGGR